MSTIRHNPNDPLLKTGPAEQEALFRAFKSSADGHSVEAAIGAACNVLVNALRQAYAKREDAARRFDEIMARTKAVLVEQHYDAMGRKRGVFPFHQKIDLPRVVDPERVH